VAILLGAKPQASIRPYYEFAAVILFFPAIIYCALLFEPAGVGRRVWKFLGGVLCHLRDSRAALLADFRDEHENTPRSGKKRGSVGRFILCRSAAGGLLGARQILRPSTSPLPCRARAVEIATVAEKV
jgi:hypothetical protein